MFRLFNESNDIPALEIKKGQHLDRAKLTKVKAFFSSFLYQNSPNLWTVFYTDKDYIYWGKPQKNQVTPSLFNKTAISDLQAKIVRYDNAKKNSLKSRVAAHLQQKYDLIDGAQYEVELAEEFNLTVDQLTVHLLIPSKMTITPVIPEPNPKSHNYSTTFKAIFDLETLALNSVEELAD